MFLGGGRGGGCNKSPSFSNLLDECSLELAKILLERHYLIAHFNERYEQEAWIKLVFSD